MSEHSEFMDQPRSTREGEEVDLETLEPFLCDEIEGLEGPLEVKQFPSGHSNLTYFISSADGREFVLRRPPFGANVKSGHDMKREYDILSRLHPVWPKVPRPYLYTEDDEILGAPFYVMERVEGVILRGSGKNPELDRETMSSVCDGLIQTMVEIHDIDLEEAGLADFGKPEGYVRRQIEGWTRRWNKAKTEEIETLENAAEWLAANMPEESGVSLIHNDFKYDNLVLNPDDLGQVTAVLDWEMATVGDPLMDLGSTLAYWVEPDDAQFLQTISGPTAEPGNLDRNGLARRYAELSGRDISDILFYYVYGLFKVAVIGQQIYYRYEKGYTQDERFGALIWAVKAIGDAAQKALDTGEISS